MAFINKDTLHKISIGLELFAILPFGEDENTCNREKLRKVHDRDRYNWYIIDSKQLEKLIPFKEIGAFMAMVLYDPSIRNERELKYFIESRSNDELKELSLSSDLCIKEYRKYHGIHK